MSEWIKANVVIMLYRAALLFGATMIIMGLAILMSHYGLSAYISATIAVAAMCLCVYLESNLTFMKFAIPMVMLAMTVFAIYFVWAEQKPTFSVITLAPIFLGMYLSHYWQHLESMQQNIAKNDSA